MTNNMNGGRLGAPGEDCTDGQSGETLHGFEKPAKSTRLTPEQRKSQILAAACHVASQVGYRAMTTADVTGVAGCGVGLVCWHFGSLDALKTLVIEHAVRTGAVSVIAEAIGDRRPEVRGISDEIKQQAIDYLTT